jgi:hypothetical protein
VPELELLDIDVPELELLDDDDCEVPELELLELLKLLWLVPLELDDDELSDDKVDVELLDDMLVLLDDDLLDDDELPGVRTIVAQNSTFAAHSSLGPCERILTAPPRFWNSNASLNRIDDVPTVPNPEIAAKPFLPGMKLGWTVALRL